MIKCLDPCSQICSVYQRGLQNGFWLVWKILVDVWVLYNSVMFCQYLVLYIISVPVMQPSSLLEVGFLHPL